MKTPAECGEAAARAGSEAVAHTPRRDAFQPGLLRELSEPPRKVALLKASRIGDFINTFPAFHALRTALPAAEITIITLPMLLEVAARCPDIDRAAAFPGYPGLAEQFFQPASALAFLQEMQAEQFDLAVQIQGTGVYSNPFTLMLGARWTAGFVRDGDPPGLLDAALPWPQTGHEAARNLALTTFLGAPGEMSAPRLALTGEDRSRANEWLNGLPAPWIGIHTSARDKTRRWPVERFTGAAAALQRRFGGTVILIGEARDREGLEAAAQTSGAPFYNLAGCTSIPVTAAVIEQLAVFLTNDTGPAHIGYAVGAPVVTIFGGGDPLRNGPLTDGPHRILAHPIDCRPCETGDCPIGLRCLESITIEAAAAAAEEIIRSNPVS